MKMSLPPELISRLDTHLTRDGLAGEAAQAKAFRELSQMWMIQRHHFVPGSHYLRTPLSITFQNPQDGTPKFKLTTKAFFPLFPLFAAKEHACYMAIFRAAKDDEEVPLKLWVPPRLFQYVPYNRRSCLIKPIPEADKLLSCNDIIATLGVVYDRHMPDEDIEDWQDALRKRCQ